MYQLNESQLRELAFQSWQSRGCPQGSPEVDWQAAINQLEADNDAQLANYKADQWQNVDNSDYGTSIEVLTLGLEDVDDTTNTGE